MRRVSPGGRGVGVDMQQFREAGRTRVIYSMKAHAGNPVTVYLIPSIMGSQ